MLGGHQCWFAWVQKVLPPRGFDTYSIRPIVICSVDYIILAHKMKVYIAITHQSLLTNIVSAVKMKVFWSVDGEWRMVNSWVLQRLYLRPLLFTVSMETGSVRTHTHTLYTYILVILSDKYCLSLPLVWDMYCAHIHLLAIWPVFH